VTAQWARGFADFWPDVVLVIVALLLTVPTIVHPYGPDQALYSYVGREWALRGSIPYRDVYDHKTPGIYVIHALLYLLTGENLWALRVAEVAAVLGMGAVVARLATPTDQPVARGVRGAAVLFVVVVYYGFFDYWNTGQSEIWYGLVSLIGVYVARHGRRTSRDFLAGLLGGCAFVIKPPSVWFAILAALILLSRRRAEAKRFGDLAFTLVRMAIGFAVFPGLMLAYFGYHHALGAMFDIVVSANGYYIAHDARVDGVFGYLENVRDAFSKFAPLSVLIALGVLRAWYLRKDPARQGLSRAYVLAIACILAATAAVAMQKKFFWLHWGVAVGPLAIGLTTLLLDARASFAAFKKTYALPLVAIVAPACAYTVSSDFAYGYWVYRTDYTIGYLLGKVSRADYLDHFKADFCYFYLGDTQEAVDWIVANSAPDDRIIVRGFQPQFYILSKRWYGGRFYWSNFLTDPKRAHRRAEYLAEDQADFLRIKPRYAVAMNFATEGVDSPEWFEGLGYRVVKTFRRYTILERP
jgi:hypothetical protein